MRNGMMFFAEWSQIMRVVPVTESKGLGMVQVLGGSFAGLNGAFGPVFFIKDSLSANRNMT